MSLYFILKLFAKKPEICSNINSFQYKAAKNKAMKIKLDIFQFLRYTIKLVTSFYSATNLTNFFSDIDFLNLLREILPLFFFTDFFCSSGKIPQICK